jgi:tripartite-type tricarboxylate transporter receptor subunit TctC
MKRKIWLVILLLVLMWVGISSKEVVAQEKKVRDFYKGATMSFIVTSAPGGTFDRWARALTPHLKKHTGARVLVHNMPGAGALVAAAHMYNVAKPDGLTIGIFSMPGLVIAKMLEFEAAKFDLQKFNYLGRVESPPRGLFGSPASGFKSFVDMQKATKTIRFATLDPTSTSSVDAAFLIEAFGLNAKIITGYKGARAYVLALMAGREVDVASANIVGRQKYVKKGELNLVAHMGKKRTTFFPEVPTALESQGLKPGGKKYLEILTVLVESGRMILVPPGVPQEKVLFLEKAFSASLKEPGLIGWAKKGGFSIDSLSGKDSREMIAKLLETVPKAERPKIKHIIAEKYF